MKVVGNVPEVGAYARPLALVEGLSQVAAAFLADSLCGGPFLHSSATTLRGEPASSRPWPRARHRCRTVLVPAALRKLECRVPGRAAGRGHRHLGRRRRKLFHGGQDKIGQRQSGQIRVHQDHQLSVVTASSWQPIWKTRRARFESDFCSLHERFRLWISVQIVYIKTSLKKKRESEWRKVSFIYEYYILRLEGFYFFLSFFLFRLTEERIDDYSYQYTLRSKDFLNLSERNTNSRAKSRDVIGAV